MKLKVIVLPFLALILFCSCGDTPIFTEMGSNRLKIIVKGTYETDDVSHFQRMQSQSIGIAPLQDDSVEINGTYDDIPTTFMFDIAEIRIGGKKLVSERQIIETSLLGGITKDTEPDPFFNGTGVLLANDDPGQGYYGSVQVFIRKMAFDKAFVYSSEFVYEKPAELIFQENSRYGFDFNQLQVNSYWDSLRSESGEVLRNFPLEIPIIGGLVYNKENPETVLEIRFVIKNFIKKFQYNYIEDGIMKTTHFYALADWLRDVKTGEDDIGGNILAVARAYVPGKTGIINGTTTASRYVIAIPAGGNINDYTITSAANVRRNHPCDLPHAPVFPGAYIEGVLDYCLKYEKYKYNWNLKVPSSCSNFETYKSYWDVSEVSVMKFMIPPLVAYTDSPSGNYTMSNVQPGYYDVYEANTSLSYGALFNDGQFTFKKTVTVPAGIIVTVP